MKNVDPAAYKTLSQYTVGSKAFDAAWKQVAASNKNFAKYQHDYAERIYYSPAVNSVLKNTGLDVGKRSQAVKDALWSTSIQHGSGSVSRIFKAAGITSNMSDAEILRRIYTERGANNGMKYFKSSSADVRASVVNRFKDELQDALNMLK